VRPGLVQVVYEQRLLDRFKKALKEADKPVKKELYKAQNRAARALRIAVRAAATTKLPKHGGLNKRVARSRIVVRRRLGGRNPRVTLAATGNPVQQIRLIDRGQVRHPVPKSREVWVTQRVEPGFWTETLERGAPTVRREFQKAIVAFIHQVGEGK